jgi:hypothetical protein
MARRASPGTGIVAMVLGAAQLGASCVDGVTPDCSSDASQCGPTGLDAAAPVDAPADAPAIDSGRSDAGDADADADAPLAS